MSSTRFPRIMTTIPEGRWYHQFDGNTGPWSDGARNLSLVNAKSVTATKRKKGKYIPQTFLMRFTAVDGSLNIYTLPNSWPIRNAIVLIGSARDAMLKSAGVRRSNLESYQKELRLLAIPNHVDTDDDTGAEQGDYARPNNQGQVGITSDDGYGKDVVYDYNKLTYEAPSGGADTTDVMHVLGDSSTGKLGVVDQYLKWRRNYTQPSDANDIDPDNLISAIMQQGETAKEIIQQVADESDEKPYQLTDFKNIEVASSEVIISKDAGRNSVTLEVPLGLYWFTQKSNGSVTGTVEVEVLGMRDM